MNESLNAFRSGIQGSFAEDIVQRNSVAGILTVMLLVVSTPILVASKLKMPIKASLLNLSVNNFLNIVVGIAYRASVQLKYKSNNTVCKTVVVLIIYCFLLMHTSVLAISLNNFFAVRYPFRYRMLMHGKSVALAVLATWLSTAVVCAIVTSSNIEDDQPCVTIVALSRQGLIITAVFMFIVDACGVGVNILLCKMLYARHNRIFARKNGIRQPVLIYGIPARLQCETSLGIHPSLSSGPSSSTQNDTVPLQNRSTQHTRHTPDAASGAMTPVSGSNIRVRGVRNLNFQISWERKRPDHVQINMERDIEKQQIGKHRIVQHNETSSCERNCSNCAAAPNDSKVKSVDLRVKSQSVSCRKRNIFIIGDTRQGHTDAVGDSGNHGTEIEGNKNNRTKYFVRSYSRTSEQTLSAPSHEGDLPRLPLSEKRVSWTCSDHVTSPAVEALRGPRPRQQNRASEQSTSLTIISLWSFFLNLPFVLYCFYVAVFANDRLLAWHSPMGMVASSATVINVLGIPFLYAWRFIRWKEICAKIKKCKCCGS